MMAVSYIKQFLTRILAFFHRKRPAERKLSLMIPCQVCQSTGIPVGWVCIDCKRPICDECFHEIRETGFNVQCFNPLCGRSTSDSKTIPSLIIVQQNIIQNASVDSNRFSESIFNSPYTLGEILKQVQTRTPLSYILTLPLDQIKVVIYYGFMGTPSITTKMIINILKRMNIHYETELTDLVLQVLFKEGLIKQMDSAWNFPPKDELSPAPHIFISPKGPPTTETKAVSNFRMSQEALSYVSTLEGLTGASAVDCILEEEDNRIIFIVQKTDKGKIIGRGGTIIQKLREYFRKNVEIVEYSDTPEEFVSNSLAPARTKKVELVEKSGKKYLVITVIPREKGKAIGKNGRNISRSRLLLRRHFGITNVIIQTPDSSQARIPSSNYTEFTKTSHSEEKLITDKKG